jgi:hypothetical protein
MERGEEEEEGRTIKYEIPNGNPYCGKHVPISEIRARGILVELGYSGNNQNLLQNVTLTFGNGNTIALKVNYYI